MRENRPYGSEGGEGDTFPTPIAARLAGTRTYSFRSAAGGRYWLVKMSSAFGRFLKS